MQVGNLNLGNKLFLAPMAEVTDSAFRQIAKENGAGLTFTQMISAKGVLEGTFETLKYLVFNKREKPIGVQVLANDVKLLYPAVKEIAKLQPDLIDLNCGCPIDKVTKHKLGASLLDDPVRIGKLVKSMKDAAGDIPVSVKLRLGITSEKVNIIDTVKASEDNGADLVFVHARAKTDRYNVEAKWDELAKLKAGVSIPVVGNGSVFEYTDVKKIIEHTGVDSVLVARGALGNPFIFKRAELLLNNEPDCGDPSPEEIKDTVLKHISLIKLEYGELLGLNHAKKHVVWYYRKLIGIDNLLAKIFGFNSISEIEDFVELHTEKINKGEYGSSNWEEIEDKFRYKVLFWRVK